MRTILNYLKQYLYEVNRPVLCITMLLAGFLIFINYHFRIDNIIEVSGSFMYEFIARYVIFLAAFAIPYLLVYFANNKTILRNSAFVSLVLIAPAVFSLKAALNISLVFTDDYKWNTYWHYITYWPLLLLIITALLFITWKIFCSTDIFYGIETRAVDWKPYLLMLLIMLPLVAAASTQPDFLKMYPKMKLLTGNPDLGGFNFWQKLLFEISYGSDFVTVELFFRGFLVLGFVKWAGKDAILPMAFFYCTIHFGKPLGECISSFFGGLLLGVIVYHTKSIFGGLTVHLGIAWMMEAGGYIGNQLFSNNT